MFDIKEVYISTSSDDDSYNNWQFNKWKKNTTLPRLPLDPKYYRYSQTAATNRYMHKHVSLQYSM